MSVYALILAGGEGTRFAPLSTPDRPKQFLSLVGNKSLIRQTADRIAPLIPSSHWFVATHERYTKLVYQHLPELAVNQPHSGGEGGAHTALPGGGATRAHIIGETHKKNTAPAIALAAACIYRQNPAAVMAVLPSDHVITNEKAFQNVLKMALGYAASNNVLVTLGITPTWPSPEYGYIERGVAEFPDIFRVKRFVEKPDTKTAAGYLQSGTYSWNSGMFVWKASVILEEVRRHLPKMHDLLLGLEWQVTMPSPESMANFFAKVPSVSIDYGVMEKSERTVVIPAEMGWSDVGTWANLKRLVDSGAVRVNSDVQNYITQYAEV